MIDQAARRFLLGTDFVAPKTQEQYLQTYRIYAPLLAESKPEAKSLLLKDNYERIFDQCTVSGSGRGRRLICSIRLDQPNNGSCLIVPYKSLKTLPPGLSRTERQLTGYQTIPRKNWLSAAGLSRRKSLPPGLSRTERQLTGYQTIPRKNWLSAAGLSRRKSLPPGLPRTERQLTGYQTIPRKKLALRCGLVPAGATARFTFVMGHSAAVESSLPTGASPTESVNSNQNSLFYARVVAIQLLIPTGASPTEIASDRDAELEF